MINRRQFLKHFGAAGVAGFGAFTDLQRIVAAASLAGAPKTAGEDYRALVLLFMFGGNDANNLLIPTSASDYAAYATGRTPTLALPQANLLPITVANTPGRTFGLHPAMTGIQGLFNQGRAGFVANVGPLLNPLTKTQYKNRSAPIPPDLYSHSDQQAQWQSSISDGSPRTGWGGRLGELMAAANGTNHSSTLISVTGNNLFEVGNTMTSFKVSPGNHFGFDFYTAGGSDTLSRGIGDMLALNNANLFEGAWKDTINRAIDNQRILSSALAAVPPFATVFPNTGLAQQFQMIARLIGVRQALGLKRQVFFASIGGFDTHGEDQLATQNDLFTQISGAVSAFYGVTAELGVADLVTTFTGSDFNRTFRSNGKGSDHAWGSHHLIVGGAVDGGKIHGTFPVIGDTGPDDDGSGHFIPTTSVDQYSATLATWFGASVGDLPTVFANIGKFPTANLGFMKA